LVAQPPELSQLRSSLTKGRLTKGAALPWAFSPREFHWWRSIGGPWMQCSACSATSWDGWSFLHWIPIDQWNILSI
jgi:hypothetical protein